MTTQGQLVSSYTSMDGDRDLARSTEHLLMPRQDQRGAKKMA